MKKLLFQFVILFIFLKLQKPIVISVYLIVLECCAYDIWIIPLWIDISLLQRKKKKNILTVRTKYKGLGELGLCGKSKS